MQEIDSRIEAPTAPDLGPAVLRVIEITEERLGIDHKELDHERVYDEN